MDCRAAGPQSGAGWLTTPVEKSQDIEPVVRKEALFNTVWVAAASRQPGR